jgi:hypothetical protein
MQLLDVPEPEQLLSPEDASAVDRYVQNCTRAPGCLVHVRVDHPSYDEIVTVNRRSAKFGNKINSTAEEASAPSAAENLRCRVRLDYSSARKSVLCRGTYHKELIGLPQTDSDVEKVWSC